MCRCRNAGRSGPQQALHCAEKSARQLHQVACPPLAAQEPDRNMEGATSALVQATASVVLCDVPSRSTSGAPSTSSGGGCPLSHLQCTPTFSTATAHGSVDDGEEEDELAAELTRELTADLSQLCCCGALGGDAAGQEQPEGASHSSHCSSCPASRMSSLTAVEEDPEPSLYDRMGGGVAAKVRCASCYLPVHPLSGS